MLGDMTDEELAALQERGVPEETHTVWFDENWDVVEEADGIYFQTVVSRAGQRIRETWGEKPDMEEESLLEKALTTRNLPPKEAVTGIRALEDRLTAKLELRWNKAVKDFRRMGGRRPSPQELRQLMEQVSAGLRDEFARLGRDHVSQVYRRALEAERGAFPEATMEGVDRRLLEALERDPELLQRRLSAVVEDATGILNEAIQQSLGAGIDSARVVRDAADRLGEELWKVERVIRSETTNIANTGRIAQFDKYGAPEDQYGFVSAKDRRRCPICKAADEGVGTLDDEERAEVERRGYDPALLHGNPYTLAEVKALWQVHKSFHENCRCTVRRHVVLS